MYVLCYSYECMRLKYNGYQLIHNILHGVTLWYVSYVILCDCLLSHFGSSQRGGFSKQRGVHKGGGLVKGSLEKGGIESISLHSGVHKGGVW